MALLSNPDTTKELLVTILPVLTPATIITLGWKARGFFSNLVTNHLTHMKEEILEAVAASSKQEKDGKEKLQVAVVEGNKEIVESIRQGNDRIVDTLITLQKN